MSVTSVVRACLTRRLVPPAIYLLALFPLFEVQITLSQNLYDISTATNDQWLLRT